jgi:hypothetical protein
MCADCLIETTNAWFDPSKCSSPRRDLSVMEKILIPLREESNGLLRGSLKEKAQIFARYFTLWEAVQVAQENCDFVIRRRRSSSRREKKKKSYRATRRREGYDGYLSDFKAKRYYRKALLGNKECCL